MATRLKAIAAYRPAIIKQGELNLPALARQVAKNSTFSEGEIYGIFTDVVREMVEGLQGGYRIRIDGLLILAPNMKVGGQVNMQVLADRAVANTLNTPGLWTSNKVRNWEHMHQDSAALVALWNKEHPGDPVTE